MKALELLGAGTELQSTVREQLNESRFPFFVDLGARLNAADGEKIWKFMVDTIEKDLGEPFVGPAYFVDAGAYDKRTYYKVRKRRGVSKLEGEPNVKIHKISDLLMKFMVNSLPRERLESVEHHFMYVANDGASRIIDQAEWGEPRENGVGPVFHIHPGREHQLLVGLEMVADNGTEFKTGQKAKRFQLTYFRGNTPHGSSGKGRRLYFVIGAKLKDQSP